MHLAKVVKCISNLHGMKLLPATGSRRQWLNAPLQSTQPAIYHWHTGTYSVVGKMHQLSDESVTVDARI